MGLLFWDGFDTGDAVRKWSFIDTSNTNVNNTTQGRFGGGCLGTSAGQPQAYQNITAAATVITGVAFKMDSTFTMSGNNGVIVLRGDSGATVHLAIGNFSTSSTLSIKRGDGTILATGATVPNGWHFLEVKATISDTTGTVTVRLDGVAYLTYNGDTKNAGTNSTIDRVQYFGMGNNNGGVLDDVYICDGTGSAPFNDLIGDVRIRTLLPTAAGASTQLTPTGVASNWDNVNDQPFSAATFNGSPTVGQRDTYAMSDTVTGDTVLAVQACMVAFKSDAGVVSMKTALKSGATVYYGSSVVLATTPGSTFTTTYLTDPATSAAWTVTGVNALEFGAEVA